MGIVDDFAGEIDGTIRKPLTRLIRVVDSAVDAVAEPELTREVNRQPARVVCEIVGLDAVDDGAVIVLGQHAGDGILQVEPFSEDQRWHRERILTLREVRSSNRSHEITKARNIFSFVFSCVRGKYLIELCR